MTRLEVRLPPRWTLAAAIAASLAGCTLDASPSIPEATDGGTVVVPDPRSDAQIFQDGHGSEVIDDCASVCPRRQAREIAECHPTRLEPRLARHRRHLGEPTTGWVVCYYEVE